MVSLINSNKNTLSRCVKFLQGMTMPSSAPNSINTNCMLINSTSKNKIYHIYQRWVVQVIGVLSVCLLFAITSISHAGLLERLIPQGETYTVTAVDRDVAFIIDGYIYDARQFCYMVVGDKVVFLPGRHGIDYRATVYNLDGHEQCDVLLRERVGE